MTGQDKPPMPAVPRSEDEASASELLPFKSTKINLKKSPLVLLGVLTAVVAPYLFGVFSGVLDAKDAQTRQALFMAQSVVSIFYILMILLFGLYFYSRSTRPFWHYLGAFFFVAVCTATPVFNLLVFPFRGIIPGIMEMGLSQSSVGSAFVGMFFIAGLAEEWVKAIPALICLWAAFQQRKNPSAGGFTAGLALKGPLDGVVMGLFAGAGFILAETAGQYVPNEYAQIAQQSGSQEMGIVAGLGLLLPRVFGGLTGHMGWSAIVCYFIGLAAVRPSKWWSLALRGYLIAALMHATWNSFGSFYPVLGYPIGIAGVVFAAAALLKGRQMVMAENAGAPDTGGSIIVERAPVPPPPPIAPVSVAPPPPVQRAAPPSAVREGPLALDVGGITLPLRPGESFDFADEPALGGRGQGVRGTVVPHPTRANVLGLRNSGTAAWTARLRDGSRQMIEAGQNIRLAPGVDIDFGQGLTGSVRSVG